MKRSTPDIGVYRGSLHTSSHQRSQSATQSVSDRLRYIPTEDPLLRHPSPSISRPSTALNEKILVHERYLYPPQQDKRYDKETKQGQPSKHEPMKRPLSAEPVSRPWKHGPSKPQLFENSLQKLYISNKAPPRYSDINKVAHPTLEERLRSEAESKLSLYREIATHKADLFKPESHRMGAMDRFQTEATLELGSVKKRPLSAPTMLKNIPTKYDVQKRIQDIHHLGTTQSPKHADARSDHAKSRHENRGFDRVPAPKIESEPKTVLVNRWTQPMSNASQLGPATHPKSARHPETTATGGWRSVTKTPTLLYPSPRESTTISNPKIPTRTSPFRTTQKQDTYLTSHLKAENRGSTYATNYMDGESQPSRAQKSSSILATEQPTKSYKVNPGDDFAATKFEKANRSKRHDSQGHFTAATEKIKTHTTSIAHRDYSESESHEPLISSKHKPQGSFHPLLRQDHGQKPIQSKFPTNPVSSLPERNDAPSNSKTFTRNPSPRTAVKEDAERTLSSIHSPSFEKLATKEDSYPPKDSSLNEIEPAIKSIAKVAERTKTPHFFSTMQFNSGSFLEESTPAQFASSLVRPPSQSRPPKVGSPNDEEYFPSETKITNGQTTTGRRESEMPQSPHASERISSMTRYRLSDNPPRIQHQTAHNTEQNSAKSALRNQSPTKDFGLLSLREDSMKPQSIRLISQLPEPLSRLTDGPPSRVATFSERTAIGSSNQDVTDPYKSPESLVNFKIMASISLRDAIRKTHEASEAYQKAVQITRQCLDFSHQIEKRMLDSLQERSLSIATKSRAFGDSTDLRYQAACDSLHRDYLEVKRHLEDVVDYCNLQTNNLVSLYDAHTESIEKSVHNMSQIQESYRAMLDLSTYEKLRVRMSHSWLSSMGRAKSCLPSSKLDHVDHGLVCTKEEKPERDYGVAKVIGNVPSLSSVNANLIADGVIHENVIKSSHPKEAEAPQPGGRAEIQPGQSIGDVSVQLLEQGFDIILGLDSIAVQQKKTQIESFIGEVLDYYFRDVKNPAGPATIQVKLDELEKLKTYQEGFLFQNPLMQCYYDSVNVALLELYPYTMTEEPQTSSHTLTFKDLPALKEVKQSVCEKVFSWIGNTLPTTDSPSDNILVDEPLLDHPTLETLIREDMSRDFICKIADLQAKDE
eukprot:TRINITY_DN8798_c0_g1_i8.p1 TRINITY_DN8798_c0_g1~~TRINITY_DN8798_c0_g1_i8.p1  ORF type:complete len:1153 (-),score=175.79 TRINITY_DN8798_c0_g1_i8:141-3599(-)